MTPCPHPHPPPRRRTRTRTRASGAPRNAAPAPAPYLGESRVRARTLTLVWPWFCDGRCPTAMSAMSRGPILINHFFSMGMCLSYGRVLEITQELSNSLINQYNIHGVFAPSVLRKGIFTVIAKDNIDHNATSTTAVKH